MTQLTAYCGISFFLLLILGHITKLFSLKISKTRIDEKLFMLSAVSSTKTFEEARPREKNDFKNFAMQCVMLFPVIVLLYFSTRYIFQSTELPGWVESWIYIPFFFSVTYFLSHFARFGFMLISGLILPPIHRNPLVSGNLSKFWSHDWNRWVSDWSKQVLWENLSLSPAGKTILIFLASAFTHELLFSVPFYLVYRENVIGTMTLFFLIQAMGVLLDKKVFRGPSWERRVFMYLFVILPAPLIINDAIKIFVHFSI